MAPSELGKALVEAMVLSGMAKAPSEVVKAPSEVMAPSEVVQALSEAETVWLETGEARRLERTVGLVLEEHGVVVGQG
jgi:hypothetical protein